MDYQLKEARLKYDREQQEKKDAARRRIEREIRAKEAAEKRRAEVEENQRLRRLKEAERHEVARLIEERDLLMGDGARYSARFRAVLAAGPGDKITLPASALSQLEAQGVLDKGPMFFQLQVSPLGPFADVRPSLDGSATSLDAHPHQTTHAGVLEFTSPEGCVSLPPHVWRNLGLHSDTPTIADNDSARRANFVNVKYLRLPKATFAVLQPLGLDFAELANHKAVLETSLRMHATMTVGDVLTVQHQGLEYQLRVKELKPVEAVTVLETDMEVEVVPPESGRGSGGRVLVPLTFGKALQGFVTEGEFRYYKFAVDDSTAAAIANHEVDIVITLQRQGEEETGSDADLYLSAHPNLYPSQHSHLLSSHDAGNKALLLSTQGPSTFPGAGMYSVGVYGYRGESQYKLLVESKPSEASGQGHGQRLGGLAGIGLGTEGEASGSGSGSGSGFAQCSNCRQLVPERTVGLHEAYCRRHNVTCGHPGCGAVLRKEEGGGAEEHAHCELCGLSMRRREVKKHVEVFHHKLKCECGVEMEMETMVQHKASTCPLRSTLCHFCGDLRPAQGIAQNQRDRVRGLTQHESECGSRTSACEKCQRAIMLKDLDLHMEAVHSTRPIVGGSVESGGGDGEVFQHENLNPEVQKRVGEREGEGGNAMEGDGGNIGSREATEREEVLSCPVCEAAFTGVAAVLRLNKHLDSHFVGNKGAVMDVDNAQESTEQKRDGVDRRDDVLPLVEGEGGGIKEIVNVGDDVLVPHDVKKSMKVECPICRAAVHSERDLSRHIDLVH